MSYHYFLQPIRKIHLESNLRYDAGNNGSLAQVKIFSIVGIIVLLLACINYVNLTTAGAIKRAKETSVRKVIGANKMQLVMQFFLETFIICTVAVGLGKKKRSTRIIKRSAINAAMIHKRRRRRELPCQHSSRRQRLL